MREYRGKYKRKTDRGIKDVDALVQAFLGIIYKLLINYI